MREHARELAERLALWYNKEHDDWNWQRRSLMNRKALAVLTPLTILIAFMEISGLPGAFIKCTIADIEPMIIPLTINFVFIGILAFAVLKGFHIQFDFGFSGKGLAGGLKKYGLPGILAGVGSFAAFYIGLYPFDYQPTLWKVLFEGIIYYVGVGIVEEFYVRGLFLNILERICSKSPRKTEAAVIISSVVFGLGHVPGVIGMGAEVIAFKLISTIGMGLYFGAIYKSTKNLWLPAILHFFIDICALPYCFTSEMFYPPLSMVILSAVYLLLGIYSFLILKRAKKEER